MSEDPQTGPEQREQALARLLMEALRSETPGGGCPDAELLAAYADRGLDATETAKWESHFATCGRCRKVLAVLAVNTDEPLTQSEVEKLGKLVAAGSVPQTMPSAPRAVTLPVRRPSRKPMRWLLPGIGIAAAFALWFALRQSNQQPQFVAQNTPADNLVLVAPEQPPLQPVPPSEEVPPNPAVSAPFTPPDTNSPFSNAPSANSANTEVAQGQFPPGSQAAVQAFAPPAAKTLAGGEGPANDALQKARQEAVPAAATAADSARDRAVPAPAAREQILIPSPENTLAAQQQTAVPPAAAPNAAGALTAQRFSQLQTMRLAGAATAPAAKPGAPTFTFSSPSGTLWRAGTGGLIERSNDKGASWQAQASGVTIDLIAGSAPTNQVAWIVGHAGVILRTTDGVSWQRVTSPNATITDWGGVQATDAQHATIVSQDQHRFTTSDGQSWTAEP